MTSSSPAPACSRRVWSSGKCWQATRLLLWLRKGSIFVEHAPRSALLDHRGKLARVPASVYGVYDCSVNCLRGYYIKAMRTEKLSTDSFVVVGFFLNAYFVFHFYCKRKENGKRNGTNWAPKSPDLWIWFSRSLEAKPAVKSTVVIKTIPSVWKSHSHHSRDFCPRQLTLRTLNNITS